MGRRVDAGRHAHRRPPHAVKAQDVLAEQVVHRRPPRRHARLVLAVADGGQVVHQRVVPDVEDVRVVPGDLHPPTGRGAGDGDVLQAALDDAQRLIALGGGPHGVGVGVVPRQQAVLEGAQLEEVVLLLEQLHGHAVDRAVAVDELGFFLVVLTRHAVEALVQAELGVAVVVDLPQEGLHRHAVAVLGGPDEVVISDPEAFPGLDVTRRHGVHPLLGVHPVGLGRPGDLVAVLVGAGEEEHVVADEAVPPGQGVGDHHRVGVPHVGLVVHVIDRRRHIEVGHRRSVPTAVGTPTRRRRRGVARRYQLAT